MSGVTGRFQSEKSNAFNLSKRPVFIHIMVTFNLSKRSVLVIHNKDRMISDKDSFGEDPHPPKDKVG